MIKIMIGVVVVTVLVISTFLILDPKSGIVNSNATVTEVSDNVLKVTVEGEVYKPGTYTLDDGATMADLIEAAGGKTSRTDERAYYETATLMANNTYYIASLYDDTDACNNQMVEKVNINSALSDELVTLEGVSDTIANNIVTYRNANGLFNTIEAIQLVSGIKASKFSVLKRYIYLHE